MLAMRHQRDWIAALQRRLVPTQLPQPRGWELAVHYEVGVWPGGDYYDVLPLPDGRLLLVVGDASGEGEPSAVQMALVRSTLHACPLSSGQERLPFCQIRGVIQSPQIILGNLNRVLVENTLESQFMTLFCGVLDPVDGALQFSNAGHAPPLWWQAAGRSVTRLREGLGLPLGLGHDTTFHRRHVELAPGDVLLFASDGLSAATNAHGDVFGDQRFVDALRASAHNGAEAVRDEIVSALHGFRKDEEPRDDVTLLVLARKKQG
jgi:sigma-B regulation protein RsbU (phosphoserine phosphatase)